MVSYGDAADKLSKFVGVLILIVMDNGLLLNGVFVKKDGGRYVLILIVMDNGLLPKFTVVEKYFLGGLNPYCNG